MSYPAYSRAERIADGTVHVLGISASLIAVAALFAATSGSLSPGTFAALLVYSVTMVAMLTASGIYHMTAHTRLRPMLRRIDHAAIYIKIAGTFTPLATMLSTASSYAILAVVWGIAGLGAVRKLRARRGRMATSALPYLGLGWIGIVLLIPLARSAPAPVLSLIAAGGVIYTAGVLFYNWQGLRFANAIWHGFVLVATGCFYAAIATSLLALPAPPP